MTPKEKAAELVDKFENVEMRFNGDCFWLTGKTSKQCALIAVEEIGKIVCIYNDTQHEAAYWQQVKTEIEAS